MNVHLLLAPVRRKQLWYQVPLSAESCDLSCVRRRSEKRLRKTIRTLRKSINREQFHLHFAGSDYELGKSQSQPAELPGHCVTGQVLIGRKCGESVFCVYLIRVGITQPAVRFGGETLMWNWKVRLTAHQNHSCAFELLKLCKTVRYI